MATWRDFQLSRFDLWDISRIELVIDKLQTITRH